jgi:ammonia channel protein AmtB
MTCIIQCNQLIIAGIGTAIAYKLHYWVEREFKIDDAVGAVAVHGYAGVVGLVICGFVYGDILHQDTA